MNGIRENTCVTETRCLAYIRLGKKLWAMDKIDGSEECFRMALVLQPDNLDAARRLAWLLERTNQQSAAYEVLRRGLSTYPGDPELNYISAKLERRDGQVQKAVHRLVPLTNQSLNQRLTRNIHFELGHLYDAMGEVAQAFFHFTEGNRWAAEIAKGCRFNKEKAVDEIRQMAAEVKNFRLSSRAGKPTGQWPDDPANSPVFLVGFPRSGTTLLDLALDSHPDVQVLSEKPAVTSMKRILETLPASTHKSLGDLSPGEVQLVREAYFQTVDRYIKREPGKLLVDKLPLNIVKIPLILKVFPTARFVLAMRHPHDVCLSCFIQNFKLNNEMANFFSLEDAAHYYACVMGLWPLYIDAFNLTFQMVKMEQLVLDFEGEMRLLLDFIGVPWNDDVKSYSCQAKRRKLVHSPSYHQVMEPVNSRGINRALRYREYLKSVMETLKPFVAYFGYKTDMSCAN